jgi:Ca2+-binding RTX toxin-like protein
MDEGVGPTATNEYRSIIGTLSDVNTSNGLGVPQWVAGHSSTSKTAVQFDGKGAALATDPGELAGLSNSATVTFWIKTTQKQSTDAAQFGGTDIGWNRPSVLGSEQNGAVNDAQWGWLDNNGRLAINVGDTAGAKSTTVVADGTWHYVAMTRNATTGQTELYVDGALESTVTANGLKGAITNVFGIGYTNGVNNDFSRNITNDKYLNGAIDDLRIYSSVLTAEQVQSIRRVETDHHDIAIANDGSALKLAVTAAAYDSVTISGLLTGWVVSDGTHAATSTGTTNGIDISTWDLSAPLTITGVGATQSALLDIVATKGVHLAEQSISVVSVSNSYEGTAANNTFAGTANSDMVFGYDGDDNLSGAAGDDRLVGGSGADTLNGGIGADILEGGAGNDNLTGGTGADVFVWKLADRGTTVAPAVDTVTDFDPLSRAAGGDSLNLRDLLVGETTGTALGQDNLGKYLHFEKTGASETTLHVSTSGGFTSGYATGVEDQKIILQGADLTANGTLSDQAIIQDLLTKGKLITD